MPFSKWLVGCVTTIVGWYSVSNVLMGRYMMYSICICICRLYLNLNLNLMVAAVSVQLTLPMLLGFNLVSVVRSEASTLTKLKPSKVMQK